MNSTAGLIASLSNETVLQQLRSAWAEGELVEATQTRDPGLFPARVF
jgi:hypothetical protein